MPSVVYTSDSPDALDAQYESRTRGYTYAREGHPNAERLAQMIGALEGASDGLVTGSGMAAASAVLMSLLNKGDHVIGSSQLYGRTLRLFSDELPRLGIETSLVDATDVAAVEAAIGDDTRMILIEVVSNPTLRVADLPAIAELARGRGILLAVDNTFTTPRAVRPLDHGADVVIHSVTKLLAGHSDATLGYVGTGHARRDLMERIRTFAITLGLTPSPFDCWLAERGLYTFDLRYDRAEATARQLADRIASEHGVKRVLYPTRADHPDAKLAASLLGSHGSHVVSFEVRGGREAANRLVKGAAKLAFAPTLGDVGTTISHPASSSHRGLSPEGRAEMGISEGFFRVSVGCEPTERLITELTAAIRLSQRIASSSDDSTSTSMPG